MAMQKNSMDDYLPIKEFLSFFNMSIPSGVLVNNRHLLIMDGHGNHVTL